MPVRDDTIPAIDMARSVEFYQTLGFLQIVATTAYAEFSCPAWETHFSLYHTPPGSCENVKIAFETGHLEELVANLMASGLQFVQLPTATTAAWQKATLYDPAGNLVTLYRATAQVPITASLRATSNVMPHTD